MARPKTVDKPVKLQVTIPATREKEIRAYIKRIIMQEQIKDIQRQLDK